MTQAQSFGSKVDSISIKSLEYDSGNYLTKAEGTLNIEDKKILFTYNNADANSSGMVRTVLNLNFGGKKCKYPSIDLLCDDSRLIEKETPQSIYHIEEIKDCQNPQGRTSIYSRTKFEENKSKFSPIYLDAISDMFIKADILFTQVYAVVRSKVMADLTKSPVNIPVLPPTTR